MTWTEEQKEAIYRRGSNILVSAGAGSGKTAVLSERILDYCRTDGDIRRVLVLTFTEAAAQEMKERIRKKLMENGLSEQAEWIDSAYITTFDSYSLSIVKKYYYVLGLAKNVSVMEGSFLTLKKKEMIRSLFTRYYVEKNTDFFSFLKKYSLQDDKPVATMVEDMMASLELIVDLESFISTYEETYFSEEKVTFIVEKYVDNLKKNVKEWRREATALRDEAAMDTPSEKLCISLEELLSHLTIEDQSYEDLYQILKGFKFPRTSPKSSPMVKELKEKVGKELKNLQEKDFGKYSTTDAMKEEIYSTRKDVLFLLEMCKAVMDDMMVYKKQVSMYGFTDIAKFAIEIVKNSPSIREELMHSYDEILVDEYQDTSDIQEAFLSLIENNNRYMVGDIKQSIYRFRNANPYIFKKKYEDYSEGKGGHKIDLTSNFRSRSEVLDNINLLFNTLMTNAIGDADYVKDHQMHYGQRDYEKLVQDMDYNVDVLTYIEDEESIFSAAETEAFIVGREIQKVMESKPKVLRKDGYFEATYNDFAILIANATEFVTFKAVFEYLGIPLSIEASLDLKESILPTLYSNMLKAMYLDSIGKKDAEYYHAVVSIARSFIYSYSDEDIYQMVQLKKLYPIQEEIHSLALEENISYSDLFFNITKLWNIYDKMERIGDVDSNLVVLEHVHSTFMLLDSVGYSLKEAVEYLKNLLSSDVKMEYKPTSSAKNAVRIMTIHKSKGLEFPYCYFPLLSHGFNQADMRRTTGFHKDLGIFIPYADEGKSETILRMLNAEAVRIADISEKVRLFYVALTRAREKMILILPEKENVPASAEKYKSFRDMLVGSDALLRYEKRIDLSDYGIVDYKLALKKNHELKGTKVLSYKPLEMPKKIISSRISKKLKSLPDEKLEASITLGLKFHSALESLDLKNPEIDSLPMDDFMKNTLREILSHPIFQKIKEGKEYHENEFYFTKDGIDYHGIIDLFVEYENHIDIIDYKLSNTDSEEYIRQLAIYKSYLSSKSPKPISCYLLSILKKEIKKIEV